MEQPLAPVADRDVVLNSKVEKGCARIHFYLGGIELYGKISPMNEPIRIFINGIDAGIIGNHNEFIAVNLYPGKYTFSCDLLNTSSFFIPEEIKISIEDQGLYFLETNVKHDQPSDASFLLGGLIAGLNTKFYTRLDRRYKIGQQAVFQKRLVLLNNSLKDNVTTLKAK